MLYPFELWSHIGKGPNFLYDRFLGKGFGSSSLGSSIKRRVNGRNNRLYQRSDFANIKI